MRTTRIALAVLALSALAGIRPVSADVRPPVEVNILGEPRAAMAGREFVGTLRFRAGAPMKLNNLSLAGAGWSLVSTEGLVAELGAGEYVDVPFVVTPARDDEPLVVKFEVDGSEQVKVFDLSPAAIARLLEPGKTERRDPVDPAAAPDPAGPTPVAPAPASPAELAYRGEQTAPSGGEQANARWITVHGRFLYTRNDGFDIGADGVSVKIWDNDSPFGSELLANVATDAQGWYSATFYWNPCAVFCDGEPDIYVEFRSENSEYVVKSTAFLAGAYSWVTGTVNDYTGSNLDFGWLWPAAEGDQPALHVLTNLVRGWRYHLGYGFDMTSIDAYWPDGADGAWYNGAVHFGTGEQWAEGTIIHEQGHHWVSNFGVVIGPDYCNGICDVPSCGHCVWCQETDHDAWAEGFPNFLGEAVMATYLGTYGRAPQGIGDGRYMLENLGDCGASDDPYRTENFLGALLHDITDGPSDDSFPADAWRDRLWLGVSTIFTVADLDGPTTPANFLTKFANRYPSYREDFWETGKNNGYDFDVTAPGAVTGLTSPSHSIGGDSPDPTADFNWVRPSDDASGVGGYGVSITTGGPAMPSAFQNIGNVTSYSTSTLSPGTYWFNIRAVDRAGRWSGSYAAYGPFTVRVPVPANLAPYAWTGWSYPAVVRNAADATFGSVPEAGALDGNAATTYWTIGGWNAGEQSTGNGFQARAYVDDDWYWWVSWGAVGAGGGYWNPNMGPLYVRGGRHTFEVAHDAVDEVAETNEVDNFWAHQWVWSPLDVSYSAPAVRGAPPLRTAGWSSIVDGSTVQYNCDGLRFASGGWWNAITLRSHDASHDYDLRLHSPSTGPTNGFNAYTQWSSRVDELDAVLVNRNTTGLQNWDVGVINWDGGASNYSYEHVTSSGVAFNTTTAHALGTGESMDLFEVYLGPSEIGAVSFVVQITDPGPAGTPLRMRWLDETFTTGSLSGLAPMATTDAGGLGRIDTNVPGAGYHCLMVYRELDAGLDPLNYTVRIHRTPPDFTPYHAGGWYSPFVPRAAPDGTGGSVPAPATLFGDVSGTYFNFANINASPTAAPGLWQQAYEDGVYRWWLSWGGYPAYAVGLFNWGNAWTVRGGRHLLSTIEDPNNDQEEIWENNNAYGAQWVWTPTQLAPGGSAVRSTPPEKTGGWDHGTVGSIYWNCDGLRTPAFDSSMGWWGALALMPLGAGSDYDPRLHEVSAGAQDGFAGSLAQSYFYEGQSDYVLANFNLTVFRAFDVGIVKYGAGADAYRAEATSASYLGTEPAGVFGPYPLGANRIVALHEVWFNPGLHEINLFPESGSVDWGLTIHPSDQAYQSKATALPGGLSWLAGTNESESAVVDILSPGYYCVAVWKSSTADLPWSGSYTLQFTHPALDAPGGPSGRTALRGAFPNPLATSTSVRFELSHEQPVQVEVFDLHGARVRTLADGALGAGEHTLQWRGDDDRGGAAKPGVYLIRLRSGGVSEQVKVIKLD